MNNLYKMHKRSASITDLHGHNIAQDLELRLSQAESDVRFLTHQLKRRRFTECGPSLIRGRAEEKDDDEEDEYDDDGEKEETEDSAEEKDDLMTELQFHFNSVQDHTRAVYRLHSLVHDVPVTVELDMRPFYDDGIRAELTWEGDKRLFYCEGNDCGNEVNTQNTDDLQKYLGWDPSPSDCEFIGRLLKTFERCVPSGASKKMWSELLDVAYNI